MNPAVPVASRVGRRPAFATALVGLVVVAALAAVLVPWSWVLGGRLSAVPATDVFSPAEIARAERVSALRRQLGWTSYVVSLAVALALGFTPLGARLLRRLTGRLPAWLAVFLGGPILALVDRLVVLPVSVRLRLADLRAGLTRQGWEEWALDYAKSWLVTGVLGGLVLLVVVGSARRRPRVWFAWAGGLLASLVLAASYLYPVVVEPLFNSFTSLPPGPFKSAVFALAKRQGVRVDDVLVADASRRTTTLNAYVSGFASTRRVVVYDTLLADLTPQQARVVVAHELAHAEHRDVVVGTVLGASGTVAAVAVLALLLDSELLRRRAGVTGPGDPAAAALILALVAAGGFLASPLQSAVSRAVEARADSDALAVTGERKAYLAMQRQLAVHARSDPTPPWLSQLWFGSHPTVLERVGLAEASRRRP